MSRTTIFARQDGATQVLAYQMRLSSAEDVAMILPLPTAANRGGEAVRFVDLSGAPALFAQLDRCFEDLDVSRSLGRGVVAAGPAATLPVHKVGAYDASFVPTPADFSRLDPRFRLPGSVLDGVPAYHDYGFAVFKLRSGDTEVHPMGLRFATRFPDRLFFPTVHVHHRDVPDRAAFDHTLYLQTVNDVPAEWEHATREVKSVVNVGNLLHRDPTRGLISPAWPVFRRRIKGVHPNGDTWV